MKKQESPGFSRGEQVKGPRPFGSYNATHEAPLMCPSCGQIAVITYFQPLGGADLTDTHGPDKDDWPVARLVWCCKGCWEVWDMEGKPTWKIVEVPDA